MDAEEPGTPSQPWRNKQEEQHKHITQERGTRRKNKGKSSTLARSRHINCFLWVREQSNEWWDLLIDLGSFGEDDWMDHFRMSQNLFDYICEKLRPLLSQRYALLWSSVSVSVSVSMEKRVAPLH